jgi:hypothetical protein
MSINRNLLIECSSQKEADKVFDYLKSKGELINTNSFSFDIGLTEWYFIGYYKIHGGWTIARKDHNNFGNKIISATEFLNPSLVGRWVKFLKNFDSCFPIGSYDLITKDTPGYTTITLEKYTTCARTRIKNGDLELMPEGWSPDVEEPVTTVKNNIPEYVECVQVLKNGYGELGKIYKVDNWNHSDSDCMLVGTTSGSTSRNRFKPSTKEAYDAQFNNNNNFIVGKWYKYNGWYIKYKETGEKGIFRSSEEINIYNNYFKGVGQFGNADSSKVLLKDLTEIQPYLPDNHPDKINKEMTIEEIQEECKRRFPLGCTFINTEGIEHVLKNDETVYQIALKTMIFASSKLGCLYDNGKYAELVSENKVNTETNFKIGDIVTVIQNTLENGKTGMILKVDNCSKDYWNISGMEHPYNNDQIRLATKEEINSISTLSTTDYDNYHNTEIMPVISGFNSITTISCISPEIIKKPLIDNVQSINVNLRTKKLNNKLKF